MYVLHICRCQCMLVCKLYVLNLWMFECITHEYDHFHQSFLRSYVQTGTHFAPEVTANRKPSRLLHLKWILSKHLTRFNSLLSYHVPTYILEVAYIHTTSHQWLLYQYVGWPRLVSRHCSQHHTSIRTSFCRGSSSLFCQTLPTSRLQILTGRADKHHRRYC